MFSSIFLGMAVDFIEIRYNKKRLLPMLILLVVALAGGTYFTYFYLGSRMSLFGKVLHAVLSGVLIYDMYLLTKRIKKNQVILAFNTSEIRIFYKGNLVTCPWSEIKSWNIRKDSDSGTYYLNIEMPDKKREINISWLDKKPAEIEKLMEEFKK